MANIERKVEDLIKKTIEDLGYTLYDVQYVREGQNYFLRVFIEKTDGSIDLNDCEKVNDGINDILDTADYIKEQYFLEVSSTGLEKVLRKDIHLKQNLGNEVQVNLFKPIENESNVKNKKQNKQKEIIGKLQDFNEENIVLESEEGKILNIERKNISQIKTVYNWDNIN